jgi:hypothetical protein
MNNINFGVKLLAPFMLVAALATIIGIYINKKRAVPSGFLTDINIADGLKKIMSQFKV